jgi:hypothetical protein
MFHTLFLFILADQIARIGDFLNSLDDYDLEYVATMQDLGVGRTIYLSG